MILESIVLASASPRRLELLRSLGLTVQVEPSSYHEPDDPSILPANLAIRHAAAKAREVQARFPDELVVAADTVSTSMGSRWENRGIAPTLPAVCEPFPAGRMRSTPPTRSHFQDAAI